MLGNYSLFRKLTPPKKGSKFGTPVIWASSPSTLRFNFVLLETYVRVIGATQLARLLEQKT